MLLLPGPSSPALLTASAYWLTGSLATPLISFSQIQYVLTYVAFTHCSLCLEGLSSHCPPNLPVNLKTILLLLFLTHPIFSVPRNPGGIQYTSFRRCPESVSASVSPLLVFPKTILFHCDHGISVLHSPLLQPLPSYGLLNMAARVTLKLKSDHVTPLLKTLQNSGGLRGLVLAGERQQCTCLPYSVSSGVT